MLESLAARVLRLMVHGLGDREPHVQARVCEDDREAAQELRLCCRLDGALAIEACDVCRRDWGAGEDQTRVISAGVFGILWMSWWNLWWWTGRLTSLEKYSFSIVSFEVREEEHDNGDGDIAWCPDRGQRRNFRSCFGDVFRSRSRSVEWRLPR